MNFHEVRFPARLSFGSVGGPERRTEIVTLNSGHEERNSPWEHARRRYDAGVAMQSTDDLEALISFFEARMGRLYGFRWKDWSDYKSCLASKEPHFNDQVIAVGDGSTAAFQLCKTYHSGGVSYRRPITKPVVGRVLVAIDGVSQADEVDFTLGAGTGMLNFAAPPAMSAIITAGFAFDVPVRFDTDRLDLNLASFQAGHIPNVPVVEVRV